MLSLHKSTSFNHYPSGSKRGKGGEDYVWENGKKNSRIKELEKTTKKDRNPALYTAVLLHSVTYRSGKDS